MLAGDQVVLPDVVGDRDVDVALQVRVVGQPAARLRVEVQLSGSPRGRCCRSARGTSHRRTRPPGPPRGPPRAARAGTSAARWPAIGPLEVEEREDEHLVPEDVAAVGLAVPAARRDADVQVRSCAARRSAADGRCAGAGRSRSTRWRCPARCRSGSTSCSTRRVMASQQPVKSPAPRHREPGVAAALRDRPVPGGVQRDDLLHGHGRALAPARSVSSWATNPGSSTSRRSASTVRAVAEQPGARRQGDPHV